MRVYKSNEGLVVKMDESILVKGFNSESSITKCRELILSRIERNLDKELTNAIMRGLERNGDTLITSDKKVYTEAKTGLIENNSVKNNADTNKIEKEEENTEGGGMSSNEDSKQRSRGIDINKVIKLHKDGYRGKEIAYEMGVSVAYIYKIIGDYKKQNKN